MQKTKTKINLYKQITSHKIKNYEKIIILKEKLHKSKATQQLYSIWHKRNLV